MVIMDAPTRVTPPGWYDDGHGQLRWWDGSQWTAHAAPLTQQAVPAAAGPLRPAQPLVEVKKSRLPWILTIAALLAVVFGIVAGAATAAALDFDTAPLKKSYAAFLQAERNQDCDAIEEVTTASFREDLFDDQTCAQWASRPPTQRTGKTVLAFRFGPIGALVARENFELDRDLDGSSSGGTIVTYTMVEENGQWKLEDADD